MFEGIKQMLFYEDNGEWHLEKKQRKIPVEELPARLREKIRRVEGQPLDLINDEIRGCW